MRQTTRHLSILAVCAVALVQGCGERTPPSPATDDTTTTGRVLVLADEDLKSIVDAEAYVFQSEYPEAELDIRYLPEAQLLKAMLNDSVRCVVTCVLPGDDQEEFFRAQHINADVVPICTDAIAVVVNKDRLCAKLSTPELRNALSPVIDRELRWKDLEAGASEEQVSCLFPSEFSGVARTLIDSLGSPAGLRASALPELENVIARVASDPKPIGFIPFAAISDLDNPKMKALREKVKLLPIAKDDTSRAFLPTQGTLADGTYPLRRPVYMVLTEAKSGLGTGFVSFVANHKGQRILLKSGLAPHKVPAREVEIVHQ